MLQEALSAKVSAGWRSGEGGKGEGNAPQSRTQPNPGKTWICTISREAPRGQCSSQQPQVTLFIGEGQDKDGQAGRERGTAISRRGTGGQVGGEGEDGDVRERLEARHGGGD